MHLGRLRLPTFLAQQLDRRRAPARQLAALLIDVAAAIKAIAPMTTHGALGGYLGPHGAVNSHGEHQKSSTCWPTR